LIIKYKNELGREYLENLIKQVDISVGNNHTIVYNLGDGKTVQYDYFKDKCTNVEFTKEKKCLNY
jgi:hypothetical protein